MEVPGFLHYLKTLFAGRTDVVPRYFSFSAKDGQPVKGYAPLCNNEFKVGCSKGQGTSGACGKCNVKAYVPLTDPLLQDHLNGYQIYGVYLLLPDNTCNFIAADFDDHAGERDPLPNVIAYVQQLYAAGFTPYVLRSQSGQGYHVYVFLTAPVPAWKPRSVMQHLLDKAGIFGGGKDSFDRLFPNQDTLTGKGLGNLIALPFQGKAMRDGHTMVLDPGTNYMHPFQDQLAVLQQVVKATEAQLDAILPSIPTSQTVAQKSGQSSSAIA